MRTESELRSNRGRTWFVTLTLSPQEHFKAYCAARLRLQDRAEDFDRLSPERQFRERVHEANREITLWLKRVRKNSGADLRYILVAERHKSGLPHFHALVSEVDPDKPLRAATIKTAWRLGFSQCKLVALQTDPKCAAYVSKYLSKDCAARVRASKGYGSPQPISTSDIENLIQEIFVKKPSPTHGPQPETGVMRVHDCSPSNIGISRPPTRIVPSSDGYRLSGQPEDCVPSERPELLSARSQACRDVPSRTAPGQTLWPEGTAEIGRTCATEGPS